MSEALSVTERPRWQRAQHEDIHLVRVTDDVYRVESESGNTYVLDVLQRMCSCPDHVYRGVSCKHQIAALLEGRYGD